MQTIIDRSLDKVDDIYFEAGDHRTLVHLSGAQFHRLMRKAPHANICSESKTGYSDLITGYFGA